MSQAEIDFAYHCAVHKLKPEREYKFHSARRWRFDFAWPEYMLAVEIEGGIWTNGRHSRGAGMEADMEKYNEAGILGWTVLRFSSRMIKTGVAIETTIKALKLKEISK